MLRAIRPKPSAEWQEKIRILKERHDRLNAGSMADEIVLREGLKIKTHPESRVGFEY